MDEVKNGAENNDNKINVKVEDSQIEAQETPQNHKQAEPTVDVKPMVEVSPPKPVEKKLEEPNSNASEQTEQNNLSPVTQPPKEEVVPVPNDTPEKNTDNSSNEVKDTDVKDSSTSIDDVEAKKSINEPAAAVGVASSQMGQHPHRNNKKLAVIVTLIVALILGLTAVYVYINTDKNSQQSISNSNDTRSIDDKANKNTDSTSITTEDVDTVGGQIEEAINSLDDQADFVDSDLSDSTLGL